MPYVRKEKVKVLTINEKSKKSSTHQFSPSPSPPKKIMKHKEKYLLLGEFMCNGCSQGPHNNNLCTTPSCSPLAPDACHHAFYSCGLSDRSFSMTVKHHV